MWQEENICINKVYGNFDRLMWITVLYGELILHLLRLVINYHPYEYDKKKTLPLLGYW